LLNFGGRLIRLRLNLGTICRHDVRPAGRLRDLAGHADVLVLVSSNCLLRSPSFRSECGDEENWVRFRLIEIKVHRFSVFWDSILANLGVYNLSANGHRLADVVLGVGRGYPRWLSALR